MTGQIRFYYSLIIAKVYGNYYRCSLGASSPEEIVENDKTVSEHVPYDRVVDDQNHTLTSGISN